MCEVLEEITFQSFCCSCFITPSHAMIYEIEIFALSLSKDDDDEEVLAMENSLIYCVFIFAITMS